MRENERKFLVGLEKLSRETGVVIGGCGCCGSPYLREMGAESSQSGYGFGSTGEVLWISERASGEWDSYDWENYKDSIVK